MSTAELVALAGRLGDLARLWDRRAEALRGEADGEALDEIAYPLERQGVVWEQAAGELRAALAGEVPG